MPQQRIPGPARNITPVTTETQRQYYHAARAALSADRWDAYRATSDETDNIVAGRYAWNVALSETLYPALHAVEVTLRNRLFDAAATAYPITAYFEVNCWLDATPPILRPAERARVQEAKRALRLALRHTYATKALVKAHMTPGRLVATLTFGFWTYLFTSGYSASSARPGIFWPHLLRTVFPGLPPGARRADVEQRLNAVRTLRNRVFHYEPIWRRPNLRADYDRLLQLCDWLCPDVARTVTALDRFRIVISSDVSRFLRRRISALARRAD